MRKFRKITIIFVFMLTLAAVSAFSLDLSEIQKTADNFATSMAKSLPFNSTMGLNWSDAHIGQLIAMPPHFGLGATLGFTTMDYDSIIALLDLFEISLPEKLNWKGFPLPGYTVDARIGGIILPFDIGVKFGTLNIKEGFWNALKLEDIDFTMNYMLVGADIRYKIVGKKKSPFKLSIGAGFNYLKGGISLPVRTDDPLELSFGSHTLKLPGSTISLNWNTKSMDFKAQASVKVAVLTPYVGLGASHAWSSAGYGLTTNENIQVDGADIDLENETIINALKNYGLTNIAEKNIEQSNTVKGWSLRAYGGFSINVSFFRFDFTGMYDILSKNYGVTFGIRFQI
ncbi:MAG: hypothetical protein FWB95_04905 [Treponema sp.]|nr:hypothetical protein [Treponema sp.]